MLIDRARHPRFAIGESSTPNADLILLRLAREYDLPRIAPLAKYGTWQAAYPEVICGIKRGFSYFHHRRGQPFQADAEHTTELLVAASPDDEHSDTHWLRSSVDGFFAREAAASGVPLLENTTVSLEPHGRGWRLSGDAATKRPVQIDADFVIDGTGEFGLVPRTLGIANRADTLATNSRTVFAHFHEPASPGTICCNSGAARSPIIRFAAIMPRCTRCSTTAGCISSDSTTASSAPGSCSTRRNARSTNPCRSKRSGTRCWPLSVDCRAVRGHPGRRAAWRHRPASRRLQRRMSHMAGDNWALLPHTAGFIDPLHSTGIAQSLCGIGRLIAIFREHWQQPSLPAALARYAATVDRELTMIDKLVSGCYLARRNFRLFTACCMLYFAAAHTSEQRRLTGQVSPEAAFLLADDPTFRQLVFSAWAANRGYFAPGSGWMRAKSANSNNSSPAASLPTTPAACAIPPRGTCTATRRLPRRERVNYLAKK